jgi:hypothetical protein
MHQDTTRAPWFRHPWLMYSTPGNPVDVGYLAGIIDGEGSIGRVGNGWRITVRMTDAEVIEKLHSYGGTRTYSERKAPRKPIYCWTVSRRACVLALLEDVYPHLRVPAKRERAEVAIAELRGVNC